jgi:hypothetical protein
MKTDSFYKNILPFLPLLAVYVVLILVFSADALRGDESRYLSYVENLLRGFYTDRANPDLSNGPGYPLVLLPFIFLDLPLIIPKLFNAIFLVLGLYYFYRTLQFYINDKYSLLIALLLGIYPPLLRWMIFLYTESIVFMLMTALIYHFCYMFKREQHWWKSMFWASLLLGFLILTKIIFFQVTVLCALLALVGFTLKRSRNYKQVLFVFGGAMVFISPYLFYAFSVTGKPFYLGTRGGEILYHRSSPYDDEWGNWFSENYVLNPEQINEQDDSPYGDISQLSANHRDFYLSIQSLSNMEKDSAFKARAIENMKAYPQKYIKNTVANVGRFLFNYPISYRTQNLNAYGYLIPNMFIVVLFTLSIFLAILFRLRISFEVKSQVLFGLVYCGAMILLGGKSRYFIIAVPSLILFCAYIYANNLTVSLIDKPITKNKDA